MDIEKIVFARDKFKCVKCSQPAERVHRIIIEMPNGGHVLQNCASLCLECVNKAEEFDYETNEGVFGYLPIDLFDIIDSSYQEAYTASESHL